MALRPAGPAQPSGPSAPAGVPNPGTRYGTRGMTEVYEPISTTYRNLNNRAGRGFMLEEGHPNVIAGSKKTMHTLTAYLLMRGGALWGVGGTPGGDSQPQWAVQVITNLVDFGLGPQEAADAPRWISLPTTEESLQPRPYTVEIESRVGQDVLDELARRGHAVTDVGPWGNRSAVQVILRGPDGVLAGGSAPRVTAGGLALGF